MYLFIQASLIDLCQQRKKRKQNACATANCVQFERIISTAFLTHKRIPLSGTSKASSLDLAGRRRRISVVVLDSLCGTGAAVSEFSHTRSQSTGCIIICDMMNERAVDFWLDTFYITRYAVYRVLPQWTHVCLFIEHMISRYMWIIILLVVRELSL